MYGAYSNVNYPYYGPPYHFPHGYPQQPPRSDFPSASGHMNPSAADPWSREKVSFPQPMGMLPPRPPTTDQSPPFIPPDLDIQSAGRTPRPRPKRHHSVNPSSFTEKPLKSALKQKGVARSDSVSVPIQRVRTNSDVRQRLAPMTRTRTNSNPSFQPDHMFVSFHGSNELRLGNVAYQDTLDEIREHFIPMWPHGVSNEVTSGHSWRVTLSKNPWTATGSEATIVYRMISELFTRLSRHGYRYLTSLNTGYAHPQLVFKDAQKDEDSDFFVAYLSRSGRKITLVRPPHRIGDQLGSRLRSVWPYKIASDRASEEEIYTIELKRNAIGAHNVDRDIFVSHSLQEISLMGFKLEATVMLPPTGIFGFGDKREVWVFRGTRMRTRINSRSGPAGLNASEAGTRSGH
ncbi:hypothetical protein F5J12DRAFT_67413 [Pisolithus orientalis]|uniref:uncharacterized protein n=1 Tax=Pisolithus orientalis TaxID=936130 RepID=UPI0022252A5B|nr:uncharacterized protein F5J12DRAFT_67413 [Pisolithus orientalis]KAI6008203.1 hypothetical protein F5J12DRAFT_67413 [Pisolithus orientalis]